MPSMSFFMWSWLTVVCTIVVTIILGGGRFRPKLGLATNFSPYISSIHGHGMFSENVVWYAPHVHFRKILQPRSKNLRACQIYSCTGIKTPTAVGSYSCRIYSCRSEAAGRGAATATMPRPPPRYRRGLSHETSAGRWWTNMSQRTGGR